MALDKIQPHRIPKSLQALKQWVLWKYITRDGEPTKVPYQICGIPAKANDESTWTDVISATNRLSGYEGLGFEFKAGGGIVGIDLDGCRDPETGTVEAWAKEIVQGINSYSEVSPSKTGVKIWLRGTLPNGAGKKREVKDAARVSGKTPAIEVYDRGRYFAVTGWKLAGVPDEVEERQAALEVVLAAFFPPEAPAAIPAQSSESDVIERARAYLQRIPPAISGQNGHGATFKAACAMVLGFGLSEGDAYRLMSEWNAGCNPPWREHDLQRKVKEANKQGGERNYLRNAQREQWDSIPLPDYGGQAAPRAPQQAPPKPSNVVITTLEDAARDYISKIEQGREQLVTIGIPELDEALDGGVEPGEMVIMAARPSHGKSAIAMQCVHEWNRRGMPSVVVSEEMSAAALGKRTIQFASDVPREYWFSKGDELRRDVDQHFGQRAKTLIVEGCRNAEIAAEQIRKAVKEHGATTAVVDYAQLLGSSGKSRYEIVTNTSVIIRQVTSETKVVLILLAQLNRKTEESGEFLPKMSDLKESGQLEQDADVIVFLMWPWKIDSSKPHNEYMMFVGKNRNRAVIKPNFTMFFHPSRQMVQGIPVPEPARNADLAAWND
jgi:KaiC/GvpD/RAD55 family RecA-like ATPase